MEARIARNLRAARLAKGLKHHELAAALGVDPTYIARWERRAIRQDGLAVVPSLRFLSLLASALDRDVAWFYMAHDEEREAA